MIKESGIVERLNDSGLFGRASWSEVELLCREAATLIAELQAENERVLDVAFNEGKFHVKAWLEREEWKDRALAAESSLHRVRGENVELLRAAIAVCWFDWSENDTDAVEAIDRLGKAIRSLNITGLDTGAVKTAESRNSPSTLNAETE